MNSEAQFIEELQSLCDAYGIHEFAIYGRFAQTIGPTGLLQPPDRYVYCDSNKILAEEAAYYLNQVATPSI